MKHMTVISHRAGTGMTKTLLAESRQVQRAGADVRHTLPHGLVVEADAAALKALRASGFRIKVLRDSHLIRMNGTVIDTARGLGDTDNAFDVPTDRRAEWRHHLVAFDGPVNDLWTGAITVAGVAVVEPVSPTAVLVDAPEADLAAISKLDFVRWTGPVKPGYRINQSLEGLLEGLVKYVRVLVYPSDATAEVTAEIKSLKGRLVRGKTGEAVEEGGFAELIIELGAKRIRDLAAHPAVRHLEYASPEPGYSGERESQIMAESLDGTAAPNTAPVVGYQVWLGTVSLSGNGVTVAICDTGVDANANNNVSGHTDLRGRQVASFDYTGGAVTTDTDGHGTHVAGIAVGNAATGETESGAVNDFLWGQGVAPQSNYVTQNGIVGPWPPADWSIITSDALGAGANVMNNSWWDGTPTGSGYNGSAREFDKLVRDPDPSTAGLEEMTIVFAAGNSGPGAQTILAPQECKNVITVGNSLTFRPGVGDADDIRGLRNSSSRGPANDGRTLPNVVAPGTNVSSAYSETSWRGPIANTGSPDPGTPGNQIDEYLSLSGTSMAAPHVSGCCALLTEWWLTQTGQTPSPAMLKAILINTAEDMVGGPNASGGGAIANIPNNDQGWGRVSMENIFEQAPASDRGPRIMLDQRNAFTMAGQEYMIRVAPVDPARAMRVTLVWTDAPGAAGANPALVNDLDLEVLETGTGDTYLGNVNFVNGFSQPAAAAPADDLNNVECAYIENPNGTYEISVIAAVIARNARPPFDVVTPWQDFALVIDNAEVPPAAPISIASVIDRSGSMSAYGYVDVTRTASRQFIDLMGIDDRLGVVSFGGTATEEYAPGGGLKTITGATDREDAKDAVDAIAFGGCTFMGDGIETAGNLLAAEINERAIVLLSDGYDNKGCDQGNAAKPSAIDAATALPAGTPIYSCAMGPSSDQTLLEQLADLTGGRYYFMPTIFDLFEIYNFIRGQITGDGVVSNESAFASKGSVTGCIEAGAEYAVFTCAWGDAGLGYVPRDPAKQDEISVRLRNPKGRLIPTNDAAVHRIAGDGYVVFHISEPPAGTWRIEVETARTSHTRFTAAIFARSELNFEIDLEPGKFTVGAPVDFGVQIADGDMLIKRHKAVAQVTRLDLDATLKRQAKQLNRIQPFDAAVKDGVPDRIARFIALHHKVGDGLLKHIVEPVALRSAVLDPRERVRRVPDFSRFAVPQDWGGIPTVRSLAAASGVVAIRQPAATFGTVIDRRAFDVRGSIGRGGFQFPITPARFTGQVADTGQAGSYNIGVTVTGVAPSTGSRFCRRGLVSVVIHPER